MNIDITTALIALLGIIVGALLQYFFTRWAEISKHFRDLRSQAYVDFVKSTAGIAISQKRGDQEKEIEATILMTDAKARISIYGSKKVVDSMADFFGAYGALDSQEAVISFIEIIQLMRAETVRKSEMVEQKEIAKLLF